MTEPGGLPRHHLQPGVALVLGHALQGGHPTSSWTVRAPALQVVFINYGENLDLAQPERLLLPPLVPDVDELAQQAALLVAGEHHVGTGGQVGEGGAGLVARLVVLQQLDDEDAELEAGVDGQDEPHRLDLAGGDLDLPPPGPALSHSAASGV